MLCASDLAVSCSDFLTMGASTTATWEKKNYHLGKVASDRLRGSNGRLVMEGVLAFSDISGYLRSLTVMAAIALEATFLTSKWRTCMILSLIAQELN